MGYSYAMNGGRKLLCCDACGHAGGVRKVPCPAGWCAAWALCGSCRASDTVKAAMKESHVGCAAASAEYAAEKAAVEAVRADGAHTFVAALNDGGGVRVWFRSATGDEKETVVSRETYESLTRTSTYEEVAA